MNNNHHNQDGDTSHFIRFVARPEFLAVVGAFIGIIITGAVAWGVLTQRVGAQEKADDEIWSAIKDHASANAADHDILIAISVQMKEANKQLDQVRELLGERRRNGND
jgi:type VI protein secretion system component VasK